MGLATIAISTAAEAPPSSGRPSPSTRADSAVKITTTHEGGATQFYVENDEYCEVTMTFEMGMVNLLGSTKFPYTATFAPHTKSEAFQVSPITPGAHWGYTYTNYYKLGSSSAHHDDNFVYQLPYAPATSSKSPRVTTGNSATPAPTSMPLIGTCLKAPWSRPREVASSFAPKTIQIKAARASSSITLTTTS